MLGFVRAQFGDQQVVSRGSRHHHTGAAGWSRGFVIAKVQRSGTVLEDLGCTVHDRSLLSSTHQS